MRRPFTSIGGKVRDKYSYTYLCDYGLNNYFGEKIMNMDVDKMEFKKHSDWPWEVCFLECANPEHEKYVIVREINGNKNTLTS